MHYKHHTNQYGSESKSVIRKSQSQSSELKEIEVQGKKEWSLRKVLDT